MSDLTSGEATKGSSPEIPTESTLQADSARLETTSSFTFWFPAFLVGTTAAICLLVVVWFVTTPDGDANSQRPLLLHTVSRGDLPVTVIERGDIQGRGDVVVKCEVDDMPGDDIRGTMIIWIAPHGCSVKKGDLLVELDSAHQRERVDRQSLLTDGARASQVQAQTEYDCQLTTNANTLLEAQRAVELAEIELAIFTDPDSGTHATLVAKLEGQIQLLEHEVRVAEAERELKKSELERARQAHQQSGQPNGVAAFRRNMDRDQRQLDYNEAERQCSKKANELLQAKRELAKEEDYGRSQGTFERKLALDRAKRDLDQVKRSNDAELRQKRAALDAAEQAFRKHRELLDRYREQLGKCKIYAPSSGMVVHSGSGHDPASMIRRGSLVRRGQEILSLIDLQHLQVAINLQPDAFKRVKIGLPVTVRALAHQDRVFRGSVHSVSALPESSGQPGGPEGVHRVIITLDGDLAGLAPGMSVVAEIRVSELKDVIMIPEEAVVQRHGEHWCYVKSRQGIELRPVEIGSQIDGSVEIRQGLREGETVALDPQSVGS